ncbi:FAD-dependent monooxygenase [Nocardia sp. NPDC051990]|uniref:FAD-dependent oxidoreductase n=1 Tax=Nocardia sp. NPDC051990 TaxID=3155285 RepID=UPI00341B626F
MLACELRLAGVDVLVVERLTEPDETVKAGAINMPTAQALDRRGLLPELLSAQEDARARFRQFLDGTGKSMPVRTGGPLPGISPAS